jgi:hypothetical protein
MDIVLKSQTLTIYKINKKTKAKMFNNLKIGDQILLSVPVKRAGRNRGTYSTDIKVENLNTGECTYKTFNTICNILNNFEFEIK